MLEFLEIVRGELSTRERKEREECFAKAQKFIEDAPAMGYDAHCIKSWANRKVRGGIRVDIEIQLGKACVDDPPEVSSEQDSIDAGDSNS